MLWGIALRTRREPHEVLHTLDEILLVLTIIFSLQLPDQCLQRSSVSLEGVLVQYVALFDVPVHLCV
jgi:hypothetical protein